MKTISTRISLILFLSTALISFAQPTFNNLIKIPPLVDASLGPINLYVGPQLHKFNPFDSNDARFNGPSLNGQATWAYNLEGSNEMTILGPTLLWTTGDQIVVNVRNNVGQPTTVHWHGAEIPAMMDGGPHQGFDQGDTLHVNTLDLDSSCTMWYHPHIHDSTYAQVSRGLSGMLISREANDPINDLLPRTYGVDDIPLILGDLKLDSVLVGGNYEFNVSTIKGKHPYNVVNGVINPYVEVPNHMVRFRILNGSTRKCQLFGFTKEYDSPLDSLEDFYLVATDGGYTINPSVHTSLLTGPGMRTEVVIDLSSYAVGETLYLRNLQTEMPGYMVGSTSAAPGGGGADATIGDAFLQIRIISNTSYDSVDVAPSFTTTWDPNLADLSGVTGLRTKTLMKVAGSGPNSGFVIDSLSYKMDRIDDIVCLDAKEIWTIRNISQVAHPFHIHKIFFRVLDIDSVDANDNVVAQIDLEKYGLNGPKDDILVLPNWRLRFLAKFDDYPSPIALMNTYMYHCHILTHEDNTGGGMMHQFVVTNDSPCAVTGLDEEEDSNFKMYPNPTESEFFIEVPTSGILKIVDMSGQVVHEQILQGAEGAQYIGLADLKRGLYLVEWITSEQRSTKKLVLH